jgi:hypothetical protein
LTRNISTVGTASVVTISMPVARKIYILTENGAIQGATYSRPKAEQWLGLGDAYDYVPVTPEDAGGEGEAPETVREQPSKAVERSRQVTDEANKLRRTLEKQQRRFPVSALLQPQD